MSELEIIHHQKINGISMFFDTVEYRTPHFHPEWELIWIIDEELTVQCSQLRMCGKAGDLFLFSPNQVHEFIDVQRPATFLCLQVAPQVFAQICPEFQSIRIDPVVIGDEFSTVQKERILTFMRDLMRCYLDQGPFFSLHFAGICAELFCLVFQMVPVHKMSTEEQVSAVRRNARLSRFLSFVDENYMHKILLSDFAAAENCSVSYMSRFLKENLNQTFQEYVNSIRYHSACSMIRAGGKRMLEICEESGFSDYRYFSNCFKKYSGMTPEEYSRSAPVITEQLHQKSIYSREQFYTRSESYALLGSLV